MRQDRKTSEDLCVIQDENTEGVKRRLNRDDRGKGLRWLGVEDKIDK